MLEMPPNFMDMHSYDTNGMQGVIGLVANVAGELADTWGRDLG